MMQRPTAPLVDIHAHVFNASDLPIESFLEIVFLHLYPPQGVQQLQNTKDREAVDWLIKLLLWILGADGAPTARDEIKVLKGTGLVRERAADLTKAADETVVRTAEFLRKLERPGAMFLERSTSERGASVVRDALRRAGGVEGRPIGALDLTTSETVARNAYASHFDMGVYLRWFTLFTLYRHVLVEELTALHQRQGFSPIALAPSIIDYSKWLGEEVVSPLADQIEVMGLIAKRPGPAIHGLVAFDPLHDVYFRTGHDATDPLALVRTALVEHGFAGVKIYPPMGFFPDGNTNDQGYPKPVRDLIGDRIGDELNSSLDALYTLCVELDAPILAHTQHTNGAGPHYEDRADPAYWIPVFTKHPKLRVCLAHFGHFDARSHAAPVGSTFPAASWEWVIGNHLAGNPSAPVFVDLGYFAEVLTADAARRKKLAQYVQDFVRTFDPGVQHIMFGSDWVMLGAESGHADYTKAVVRFLTDDCALDAAAVGRVMVENASRFLGVREDGPARRRLLRFYEVNGLPPKLQPLFRP